jgi:hypothetical protein
MTGRAAPRLRARRAAASFLIAVLPVLAAPPATDPLEIDDYSEIDEHLIEPPPTVATPWTDLTADNHVMTWDFDLTVDEGGTVTDARLPSGPPTTVAATTAPGK